MDDPNPLALARERARCVEVTEEKAGRAKVDKWWETPREPVAYRYKKFVETVKREENETKSSGSPLKSPATQRTHSTSKYFITCVTCVVNF